MKKYLLPLLAACTLHSADARTWTSADGENFFSAIYLRSDDTNITVSMEGKEASFKMELVSDEDKAWVKAEEKRLADAEKQVAPEKPTLDDQYIGKNLNGNTAHIALDKFKAMNHIKVPDYYFFYYSASW